MRTVHRRARNRKARTPSGSYARPSPVLRYDFLRDRTPSHPRPSRVVISPRAAAAPTSSVSRHRKCHTFTDRTSDHLCALASRRTSEDTGAGNIVTAPIRSASSVTRLREIPSSSRAVLAHSRPVRRSMENVSVTDHTLRTHYRTRRTRLTACAVLTTTRSCRARTCVVIGLPTCDLHFRWFPPKGPLLRRASVAFLWRSGSNVRSEITETYQKNTSMASPTIHLVNTYAWKISTIYRSKR